MNSFADFEYLFPSLTPPVRVIVTNDPSRDLNSMMAATARRVDEVNILLFATSADVSHDEHVDPNVVVDNLLRHARKFFRAEPTAEQSVQCREELLAWVRQHRAQAVSLVGADP